MSVEDGGGGSTIVVGVGGDGDTDTVTHCFFPKMDLYLSCIQLEVVAYSEGSLYPLGYFFLDASSQTQRTPR